MVASAKGLRVSITGWHPEIDTETCTANVRTVIETALAYCSLAENFSEFRKFALDVAAKAEKPEDRAEWIDWWSTLTEGAMSWIAEGVING